MFDKPPPYLPTSKEGFVSFVNLHGFRMTADLFCESSPHCMRRKVVKPSSIYIVGNRIPVVRRTYICSGIKSCSTSLRRCKESHNGIWKNSENNGATISARGSSRSIKHVTEIKNNIIDLTDHSDYVSNLGNPISSLITIGKEKDYVSNDIGIFQYRQKEVEQPHYINGEHCITDYEENMAKQVFYYAQNAFPLFCKHVIFVASMDQLTALQNTQTPQYRIPNWVSKPGKKIFDVEKSGKVTSSKLPDFIGCSSFGKEGVRDPKKCTLVKLLPHLQGASPDIMTRLVAMAHHGQFPVCSPNHGDCPPYPLSTRATFCMRPVHLQEAPKLIHLKCDVEYHYFLPKTEGASDEYLSWAVVVGFGSHNHTWPVMRPAPTLVNDYVRDVCQSSEVLTGPMIMKKVEERFGCVPSPSTIKSMRRNVRRGSQPCKISLAFVIEAFETQRKSRGILNSYIISIEDYREADQFCIPREQKGLSIIFGDRTLLDKASEHPRLGCDGKFSVVNRYDEYGEAMKFELVSIVAKDQSTGCIYSVMHQFCTRKTTASRSLLFTELIKQLRRRGLCDPLGACGKRRLTMATDFETTYAFSLGQVRSDNFMSGTSLEYIKAVAVGCDVHAKRCIMEKVNLSKERTLFNWAVGTRNVDTLEECQQALEFMKGMGSQWECFANWLATNKCAFILWFQSYSCTIPSSERHMALFFDTNGNETYHNRIKSRPKYAMSRRRGLEFLDAMQLLKEIDSEDANKVTKRDPVKGYQKLSTPQWKEAQRKARKRNLQEVIVIDGDAIPAQQPKKAKKSNSPKAKKQSTKFDNIDSLKEKIIKLEGLVEKLIEQNMSCGEKHSK